MTERSLRNRALLAASALIAGLGLAVVVPGTASGATLLAAGVETRDPLTWPFARDSIWNTPIGSQARYVHAGLQAANAATYKRVTADPEYISVNPNDPVRTLSVPGQPGDGAQVRVAPDIAHNGSWNGCSTLLTADGTSVWSGQPLKMAAGGTPTWTWTTQKTPSSLRGDGIEGCHGGSRMSGIGGSLRVGELAGTAPLRHALKVNLYCKKYCYKGVSKADSKRWPALTADSYWETGYSGTLPALKMGALLAVPPTTDLSAITHPKVRKMAMAFRDYGAYLVDDTYWDVHAVDMDQRMVKSGEWPSGTDTAFHAQLQQVFQMLAVVDNNSPTSVGGGGTPRAPLAPCFADDTACITSNQQQVTTATWPTSTTTSTSTTTTTTTTTTTSPSPSPSPSPSSTSTATSTTPTATATPTSTATPTTLVDPWVSALTPTKAVNGYGPYARDLSNGEALAGDGRTLTLNGRTHARGLGVHAGSALTYDLGKRYAHFTAEIGVDDEVGSKGSVVFEVWLDGKRTYVSPRLTGSSAPVKISLSTWKASTMQLVVTDSGDKNAYDHADWGSARLWSP